MGSKSAGVLGGIFVILGIIGLILLTIFAFIPQIEAPRFANTMWVLYLGDTFGIWTSGINWSMIILPGLTLEDWLLLSMFFNTIPVISINFWGWFQVQTFWCIMILSAFLLIGAILSFAAPDYY